MSIYDEIKAVGFETDSHESDLYVKATPEFIQFMKGRPTQGFSLFRSQVDNEIWAELPFMFSPFWEGKPR
jgi:hypothetical protein